MFTLDFYLCRPFTRRSTLVRRRVHGLGYTVYGTRYTVCHIQQIDQIGQIDQIDYIDHIDHIDHIDYIDHIQNLTT